MTSQDYTPEEYGRMYQQEARIKEMQEEAEMVIEDQDSLWRAGFAANQRYTKDLEDMLERTLTALEFVGMDEDLIAEAKALLERTGYTEDF